MVFAYSTFVRKQALTTEYVAKQAKKGNLKPLATMLVVGGAAAEAMILMRDYLKDRERERENELLNGVFRDMGEIGVFGLWSNMQYALRHFGEYGHDTFSDILSPPQLEFMETMVNGVLKSIAEKDLTPLAQGIRRTAPLAQIVGAQIEKQNPKKIAESLVNKVYISSGSGHRMLDPVPAKKKDRTTAMKVQRLRDMGYSDGIIRNMVKEARDRKRKKTEGE